MAYWKILKKRLAEKIKSVWNKNPGFCKLKKSLNKVKLLQNGRVTAE
jgi:hypothetical protein